MGLYESIFDEAPALSSNTGVFRTLTAYRPVWTSWGGRLYESELIRAAIDAIARHASKLTISIQGSARPRLKTMIRSGPNAWQTYSQFLYRTATILYVQNNAFIVPVLGEDSNGEPEPLGFFTVLPNQAEIVEDGGIEYFRYKFRNGEIGVTEMDRCGLLSRYQYEDDIFGSSNKALSGTMELINMQQQGIREGIKNGATFRFMAKMTNFLKPEDLAKERERFNQENLQGESGGVLLFPNTYSDPKQIDQKPYVVDADQMKMIQENVFNYYGVNMDVLQNKAVGDSWAAFYDGALEPFAVQLSQAMTRMTFTRREIAQGNMVTVTANRLQYASTEEKLKVSAQMADRGIMTRNEIRQIWSLAPVPGGDRFLVRGEYKDPDKEPEENILETGPAAEGNSQDTNNQGTAGAAL